MYDVDFDHQIIEIEKYDAKPTYKKFFGYRPGVSGFWGVFMGGSSEAIDNEPILFKSLKEPLLRVLLILRDLNRMGSLSIASELIVEHAPRKSWRK